MSELRRVTLNREQRRHLTQLGTLADRHRFPVLMQAADEIVAAWDAAETLPCPACDGVGLVLSIEGCGVRVRCRVCHGTGLAS